MSSSPQSNNANNNNANNNNAAEASFRRSYAAALAEALREADERPVEPTHDELCHDTYVQLCTDDPVVTPQGCRALAKALLLQQQKPLSTRSTTTNSQAQAQQPRHYALSDRLVDGIVLVCQRIAREQQQKQQKQQENANANDDQNKKDDSDLAPPASESLLLPPTSGSNKNNDASFSSAYATLAWTVFGKIPLQCCLINDTLECAAWLGSYRGPALLNPAEAVVEEEEEEVEAETPENNENNKTDTNDNSNENDSLAEVWAAESDPSDYGFDSGYDPQQQLQELEQWARDVQIDPQQLSSSSSSTRNITWRDVALAVTHLLRQLSYSKLGGWTADEWKRGRVAEQLSQLTLTLALSPSRLGAHVAREKEHDENETNVLTSESHWQQLALQPLHTFRDAVAVHTDALLPEYLDLLQNLIQVDHQLKKTTTPTTTIAHKTTTQSADDASTRIAPATWMGLGALSALCSSCSSSNARHVSKLRTAVLQVSDDVTSILEQCHDSDAASAALPWTCLSLLQILVTASSSTATSQQQQPLTNAQAQTLLNSGLFREWLVWWNKEQQQRQQQQQQQTTASTSELKTSMEWNLFHLCATCPTLLGKYAWRYPGFAGEVTTTLFSKQDSSSSSFRSVVLLWNLLGISLARQASSSVQWRNKTSDDGPKPPPTLQECQRQAWEQYTWLCKAVARVLERWKEQRVQPQDAGTDDSLPSLERDLTLLDEFRAFSEALSQTWLVVPVLCYQMNVYGEDDDNNTGNSEDSEKKRLAVRQSTAAIQKALNAWIPTPHEVVAKLKLEDEEQEEQDPVKSSNSIASSPLAPVDRMHRQRPRLEDDAVAMTRKSLKLLQSAIDSCAYATGSDGHPPQARFSSKAD